MKARLLSEEENRELKHQEDLDVLKQVLNMNDIERRTVLKASQLGMITEEEKERYLSFCDEFYGIREKNHKEMDFVNSSEENQKTYRAIMNLMRQINERKSGKEYDCCICGEHFWGYGNNPDPISTEGRCCDECNERYVVAARVTGLNLEEIKEAYAEIEAGKAE